MKVQFNRIVIVGVGLIGGSLGMAVRQMKLAQDVTGVDLDSTALDSAISLEAIDRAETDIKKAVQGSDLVVLATPVGHFEGIARKLSGSLDNGTIVTDVGSVKGPMVERLERQLSPAGKFVGGHPIAGRERSGVKAASAALFKGAACILTPTPRTDPDAKSAVKSLWEAVGCRVVTMDPDRHDRILAAVSHLPHVAAFALVNLLSGLETGEPDLINHTAGGFRDFTRIAASSPEMWRDICLANGDSIIERIEEYRAELDSLKRMILNKDSTGLKKVFERANAVREKLNKERD